MLWGHHFIFIYYTVIHGDLDPYCSFRNPSALHLNAFVLNLAHFLLCYFGGIIFLEYESGLWAIAQYRIWDSVTVSELFQNYENRRESLLWGRTVKLLICFHVGFS